MDNRAIGFFDSGIGGLSVLHQAIKIFPRENFIYYADTDNVPYGIKNNNEIMGYVENAIKFLIKQDVKAIVIACNTATAVCINKLRNKYKLPIVGMEPAVKLAIKSNYKKRILLIATSVTVREKKLHNLLKVIDVRKKVDLIPMSGLVEFAEIEEFDTENVEKYLEKEFNKFNLNNYSQIILGCTHFNYFIPVIKKLVPSNIKLLDGNEGTIKRVYHVLEENNMLGNSKEAYVKYFFSGRLIQNKQDLEKINRLHNRLNMIIKCI